MASRMFYGARPGRKKEEEEDLAERGTRANKRSSIIPQPVNTSRIPTHTSMFSRHKPKREEEKSQITRHVPPVQSRVTAPLPQRNRNDASYATTKVSGPASSLRSQTTPAVANLVQLAPPSRNRLRRKASSNDQRSQYAQSTATTSTYDADPPPTTTEIVSLPEGNSDPFSGSVFGISLPTVSQSTSQIPTFRSIPTAYATSSSRMANYASSQLPHNLSTQDLPAPNPAFVARSSSASTRASISPGPFSRTSTPTSISSHSPGITVAPTFIPRLRTPSTPAKTRPPVTRRKTGVVESKDKDHDQGLPPLRESSSSTSTVKAPEQFETTDLIHAHNRNRLAPPAPTPPLRLSSKRLPKPHVLSPTTSTGTMTRNPGDKDLNGTGIRPNASLPKIPALSSTRSIVVPPRPSREGTPILEKENPSPIIQSNLNHVATTGHTRRESLERVLTMVPSKLDKRMEPSPIHPSPSNVSTSSRPILSNTWIPDLARTHSPHLYPHEKSNSRDIPFLQTENVKQPPKREPSPITDSPSKSPSRFGLFMRRDKVQAEANTPFDEKPTKKGPAAGTGHEGYGKYARRGRSGSISTTASRGRSTSTDRTSSSYRPSSSRKSSFAGDEKLTLDDFYKERLEPVVIGGGGKIKENRNSGATLYRTSSGESSASITSDTSFGPSLPARSPFRNRDIFSSIPSSERTSSRPMSPSVSGSRIGVPNADSMTLAHRRSLHRSQLFKKAEPVALPHPINTEVAATSSLDSTSLDSFDALHSSVPWSESFLNLADDLSEGHEGNWLKPKKARVKLPSKWNFFHRAQHSPKKVDPIKPREFPNVPAQLPVAISRRPEVRSIPHYAIMDSSDQEESDSLEDILRDIEDDLDVGKSQIAATAESGSTGQHQHERQFSMLLPSPPRFPTEFLVSDVLPEHSITSYQAMPTPESPAPQMQLPVKNRLQQVGRIPRVVSKRDRPHKPPPQSFSRPFTRPPVVDAISPASEPIPELPALVDHPSTAVQTEPLPSAPWTELGFLGHRKAPPTNGMLFNLDGEKEFLSFASRKGSEISGSSSSGILSFAGMTALLPRPDSLLKDDEVWNEYDELLDHVSSPISRQSSWSGRQEIMKSFPPEDNSQMARGLIKDESSVNLPPLGSSLPVRVFGPDMIHGPDMLELKPQQQSGVLLSTSPCFSDLYAGYANRASTATTNRGSVSRGSRYSSKSLVYGPKLSSDDYDEHIKRYTQVMADKIKGGPGTPDTFRFSALMIARWLSFDRVLFSPVQEEIRNNRQDKILVLDGLGNDDWSSYCALTYPDATIYNLGAPRPLSGTKRDNTSWQPPSNHRQIHHSSIAHPFPFPKGFFTAVVFRFPAASSETALRNAISECKRVLRPGGYLELCILDMDMVNMGNRARRAVRGLKVKMQVADPELSLSPSSDNVQKMLGRRGFENLNRCVVGVPVARNISNSPAGSLDDKHTSLGDLLRDPAAARDAPITKMVAKVGRWWWSRCYERGIITDMNGEESIWNDDALLRECENRDTGFRLVICYAQKPVNARRRTVSV